MKFSVTKLKECLVWEIAQQLPMSVWTSYAIIKSSPVFKFAVANVASLRIRASLWPPLKSDPAVVKSPFQMSFPRV